MNGKQDGETYVTWHKFISVMLGLIVAGAPTHWALFNWTMSIHTKQPHQGAATHREVDKMATRLTRIEDKIDEILRTK